MTGDGVYVHVCCSTQSRDYKIREMMDYLRFYNAMFRRASNQIIVPLAEGVMVHIFLLPDFDIQQLAGLVLKGFNVEFRAPVRSEQVEYLWSRLLRGGRL